MLRPYPLSPEPPRSVVRGGGGTCDANTRAVRDSIVKYTVQFK